MVLSIDKEVWKPIVFEDYDFTGKYDISNHGRVRSVDRYTSNGRHVKERILKIGKHVMVIIQLILLIKKRE